ncbi:MAG: fibronectin type III domain-containing protein [Chloroflexi bacterium]|nr:fibronectin type III domain-containing protein [Chloroflexota bacterium]
MSKPALSQFALTLCMVGAVLSLTAWPGAALPAATITVTGADGTRAVIPAQNVTLNTQLVGVSARPVVQFGEGLRYMALPTNVPVALQTLMNDVSAHPQFQFVESNRAIGLSYPAAIIDDTAAPQVTAIGATPTGDGSTATLTWTTDEFADSAVDYGSLSGNYTQIVTDSLYAKTHRVTLNGLTPQATYYYRVRSVDRDGNVTESAESHFAAIPVQYIYLPSIRR